MLRNLLIGTVAGAAGTATLNVVTNLDMVVRARPASGVPASVAGALAEEAGIDAMSDRRDDRASVNRQSGAGALLGYIAGIGIGLIYGLVRPKLQGLPLPAAGLGLGVAAMAASNVPAATLSVTDPAEWGSNEWLSDLVPHLIYDVVTAAVFDSLSSR